jgi:hypothetical protein
MFAPKLACGSDKFSIHRLIDMIASTILALILWQRKKKRLAFGLHGLDNLHYRRLQPGGSFWRTLRSAANPSSESAAVEVVAVHSVSRFREFLGLI